jgi:hypothetical protein
MDLYPWNFYSLSLKDRKLITGMIQHIQNQHPANHVTEANYETNFAVFCSPQEMAMYAWFYLVEVSQGRGRYGNEFHSWENLINGFFSELLRTTSGQNFLPHGGCSPEIAKLRIDSLGIISETYLQLTIRGFFYEFNHLLPKN